MTYTRIAIPLIIVSILLSGCASFVAPGYSPNYETIDKLKKENLAKLAVGEVQPTDPAAPINKISLRASSLKSSSGTFAKYLEEALISDLKELGLYEPTAGNRIDAVIIKNDIDISGFSKGLGIMEVKIKVSKNTDTVFEKTYVANTQFESSFAGAVAIPKGQSEYPSLVRELLKKIYEDPAFIQAIKK